VPRKSAGTALYPTLTIRALDPASVQAMMGHSKITTTERYLHARSLSDLADRLDCGLWFRGCWICRGRLSTDSRFRHRQRGMPRVPSGVETRTGIVPWVAGDVVATIFEWGGGRDAFERWLNRFYDLIETESPDIAALFGGSVSVEHRVHVTDWWVEVMGGPDSYSEERGGYEHMLGQHKGWQSRQRSDSPS
jgi:hypothetical protein